MEIWGGVECSVVRIKNLVHDQLELSGHEERISDLSLFADIGISTIRYPLLWEKFEENPSRFFQLHDNRLAKLKELNITPVGGLLHHGSGPFFTNLLDEHFPELFAGYAHQIASRYPWITYYTPINEPLTTARFSGLYGIWFPHEKSDYAFLRIFLNQIKGIMLAMGEIRKINPAAKLIQTEDLCKVHSTEKLKYQADFENNRRWLTYDFLTGNFKRDHPLWNYFIRSGIKKEELDFFADNVVLPYIAGHNYYVTSERFLDHRKFNYPKQFRGGNGIHTYADVEVVRVEGQSPAGFYTLLKEWWDRYHLPMALTEVHLGCTREEQLRWFYEAYSSAMKLRNEGIDFRAITAWSFLGCFDWDSLLCRKGHYESGVFSLRADKPVPTALAGLIGFLQNKSPFLNCLLETPGWWKRDLRVLYTSVKKNYVKPDTEESSHNNYLKQIRLLVNDNQCSNVTPVLILGGNGHLTKELSRICNVRAIAHKIVDRYSLNIFSRKSIEEIVKKISPWAIINASGYSDSRDVEMKSELGFAENTSESALLSAVSQSHNIQFLSFSPNRTVNVKIHHKAEKEIKDHNGSYDELSENEIQNANPKSLIVRTDSFFHFLQKDERVSTFLNGNLALKNIMASTYIAELINIALDLLIDGGSGILNLASQHEITNYKFNKINTQSERYVSTLSPLKINLDINKARIGSL